MTLPLPKIKLYHVPGSRSCRTLWLLNELDVPFDLEVMPFRLEVLRSPAFLAISPLGRVPALTIDDTTIVESGAIAQILSTHYGDGRLARLPGQAEWPAWLQWIHYAETIAVHAASLVQQHIFIPEGQKSEAVQTLESKRLTKALTVLDSHFSTHTWLLPSGFSAADTSIGYSIHLAKSFVDVGSLQYTAAYYERCVARPAFQAMLEDRIIHHERI